MGQFSLVHWIVVALVVILLFGRGRISETMADVGKGIRGFRKGLSDEDGGNTFAPSRIVSSAEAVSSESRQETPKP